MKLRKQTIDDVVLRDKRVIIRADFNVPLDDENQITDDTRIRSTLPTINRAIDDGAKVILCSHLGRPNGKFNLKYSLAPVAKRLGRLMGKNILFAPDCIGPAVEGLVEKMKAGDVLLLENLRFHPGEEQNDDNFSKALAALGDVYINDAFGAAHRAHASTVGITKFIPVSVAGFLLKKEIEYLEGAVENPVRPFVAILGGAKVSGKIGVIENLGKRVDKVIIGGGMAFTFLKAKGMEIGNSLVENDMLDFAKGIEDHALSRGVKFYLPVDCVVAASREPGAESKIVPVQEIPNGWYALDIGPASVKLFNEAVQNAKTILWNGPMGVFEIDAYARGTLAMAHAIADAYALTIVGGGETALAVHRSGESENMSFISTGGGAALELLEGKQLPGLTALPNRVSITPISFLMWKTSRRFS
ncbi:MAG: phosphoglycerate kinase [Nitrospira sp. CG24E]|nr:MAG: phosphoglycerate kinase [Nitrospira sp. CG24E]